MQIRLDGTARQSRTPCACTGPIGELRFIQSVVDTAHLTIQIRHLLGRSSGVRALRGQASAVLRPRTLFDMDGVLEDLIFSRLTKSAL